MKLLLYKSNRNCSNSYACDDYVINETQSKRILRALEQFQNNQASLKSPNKRKDSSNELGITTVGNLL